MQLNCSNLAGVTATVSGRVSLPKLTSVQAPAFDFTVDQHGSVTAADGSTFSIPIVSPGSSVKADFGGLEGGISNLRLESGPSAISAKPGFALVASVSLNPIGGIPIVGTSNPGEREYRIDFAGNSASIECPKDKSAWQLPIIGFRAQVSPSCDAGLFRGVKVSGGHLDIPTLSLSLNVPNFTITNSVTFENGKPFDLINNLKAPGDSFSIAGFSIVPDVLALQLSPPPPGPVTSGDLTLVFKGSVALPTWFAKGSFDVAESRFNLHTLAFQGGAISISEKKPVQFLGTTLQLDTGSRNKDCTGVKNYLDLSGNVSLCGTLQPPNFMAGTKTVYAATTADSEPTPIEQSASPVVDFRFEYRCSPKSGASSCGARAANFAISAASKTVPDAEGSHCSDPFDLKIGRLAFCRLTLLDSQANAVDTSAFVPQTTAVQLATPVPPSDPPDQATQTAPPTTFDLIAQLYPENMTDVKQPLTIEAYFNEKALHAVTRSGKMTMKVGGVDADVSNMRIDFSDRLRALHGAVAIASGNGNTPTLYLSDACFEMTRDPGGPWRYHFCAKPDYLNTGLSVLKFLASLYFAKWIIQIMDREAPLLRSLGRIR